MNVRKLHPSTGLSMPVRTVHRVLHNHELMEFCHRMPRPNLEPHHVRKRMQ